MRDPDLLRRLHRHWRICAICRQGGVKLSLHHVSKHPRDDLRENLVMLCGHGTAGCHGRVEARDPDYLARLTAEIRENRLDVLTYLRSRQREWVLDP